jgi:hypothetical protein
MSRFTLYFILFINLLALQTFAQSAREKTNIPASSKYYFKPDYLQSDEAWPYAIFKYDAKQYGYLFGKNAKASTLSVSEIVDIENLIKKRINEYNKNASQFIAKPDKYYKQFIAVINSKGEKEVWVNCCCSVMADWRKQIQVTYDGGSCYFSLKINLTKGTVYDFMVNGLA